MESKLLEILNHNPIQNIATIGFFSNYQVEEYYIEDNSAIIFGKSDQLWAHIVSNSEDDVSKLISNHYKKTKYYFSVEDWMIPIISKYEPIEWIMTTNRYILDNTIKVKIPELAISPIETTFAPFIYENSDYQKYTSIAYIKERLTKGISAALKINNKLVAWGFTHDDGALGFLHVLDEYRSKGYAHEIMLGLIQMKRNINQSIFANIVPENSPAIKLVTKLGFKLDHRVSWVKTK